MKILIVNTSDMLGGAARAAYRLHKALLLNSVDSQMLVQSKTSDDFTVLAPQAKFQRRFSLIRPALDSIPAQFYKNRSKAIFSSSWVPFSTITKQITNINPDIVHLHWIAGGMISIEDISKIKVPIVWSLHDMWAFTGGCHYDGECGKFKSACGACPVLGSNKSTDLSTKIWQRKQKSFVKKGNLTIIGLSRWLVNEAKASPFFNHLDVVHLPNPIDTETFLPFDKKQARNLFNLPLDKKLVLFGAMSATSDPRKGFKELAQALQKLDSENTELVVFGSGQPKKPFLFKQKTHYLGLLHDDISLRLLYNSADVMVVPSKQENLSNAIMESLSCGLPVVSFDVGGNSDLIENRCNGYLVKPFDEQELAKGIEWVINNPNYKTICSNARGKVLREFDSGVVAKKYIELYQEILDAG